MSIERLDIIIQKTLPLVYDDSLSYLEFLAKVVAKVNEAIDELNIYLNQDLRSYVEQKLIAWKNDGTLDAIIADTVLEIGNRDYTLEKYVTSGEKITQSIDALDNAFNNYVEIVNMPLNVKDFGAIGDGINDDTPAFIGALASNKSNILEIPQGVYKISSDITIDKNIIINGNNSHLIMINNSNFYCNGEVTDIGVSFTTVANKNDLAIELSNTSGINVNDVLILYNDSDFSYSPYRTYYKDGEFVEVSGISGNTLTLKSQLETNYNTSTCKVFKFSPIKVVINNLKITKPGLNTGATLYLNDTINSELNNVNLENNNSNDSLFIARCYNLTIRKANVVNNSTDIAHNGYGMVTRGSQNVNIYDSYFMARRHASSVGAGGITPSQTNRHIVFNGCTFKSFSSENNTHAADFHGAIEFGYYHNCTMYGGVVLGGKNTGCYDSVVYDKGGQGGLYFREIPGGSIDYINIKYFGKNLPFSIHSSDEMDKINSDLYFNIRDINLNLSDNVDALLTLPVTATNSSKLNINFENVVSNRTPITQLFYLFGTILMGNIRFTNINFPSKVGRWYRKSEGITADANTTLTLPTITKSASLTFTGSGNVIVTVPTRYAHKNISAFIQPLLNVSGVTFNLREWSPDGEGYYNYTRINAHDHLSQGALTVPFTVVIVTDNVNPEY